MQYCAWYARQTGLMWRLPHSWEWEKAARGVDGRPFPWGTHLDPTWANAIASVDGPPRIEAVDAYPLDLSAYGVRGIAGNVRDICLDLYRRNGPEAVMQRCVPRRPEPESGQFIVIRGGSYSSQTRFCRPGGRFGVDPDQVVFGVGFRLARSLDPHAS
jgi:serine/threonine-protein kinase